MSQPSDLDIRISALSQEYEATIAAQAHRGAELAAAFAIAQSNLAAEQEKTASLEARIAELTAKVDALTAEKAKA